MPSIASVTAALALSMLPSTQGASIPKYKTQLFTDLFDNLTPPPVLPATASPGIYDGINYSQFGLTSRGSLGGLLPASAPNVITVSLPKNVFNGNADLNPTSTATVSGTGTKFFSLLEFYFGCIGTTTETVIDVAAGCDVAVMGYNIEGEMVGEAAFNFAPSALEGAVMARAVLPPSFVGLVNVTFGLSSAALGVSATALNLDNVTHINYS